MWSDADDNAAISDGAVFGDGVPRDEEYGVGVFDSALDALGEPAEFVGERTLPVFLLVVFLDEMAVPLSFLHI